MKKTGVAVIAFMVFGPACIVKTVYYDVNPEYESHGFSKETIAVSPCTGKWKIEGSDTVFERVPDFYPYAEALARQIGKKRKCLSVIDPGTVAKKIPEIESLTFRHKNCAATATVDSSVFGRLHGALNAEYLIFIENILFNNEESARSDTIASIHTTILVFQLWDLKNRQFMYRGETKGSGEETRSGRGGGTDSRSGNWRIKNTACELVKALPLCK